jgi:DNA-binding transcriptional MocR family regulator
MSKFQLFDNAPLNQRGKLYEQVANQVACLIEQGVLTPGERIPSMRNLQKQLGVSLSTVIQAYSLLEDRDLIESKPQSGYYVKARYEKPIPEYKTFIPPLTASPTSISEVITSMLSAAHDPQTIPFGAAIPAAALFPNRKLCQLLTKVSRLLKEQSNTYGILRGNQALRRQLAKRSLDWSSGISREEIVTTAGCMEALNLCLRAVAKPGDTIAIESPTYYGIIQMLKNLGMRVLELPTHPQTGVCLEHLEVALKQKRVKSCLFTLNFNNPLGSCMPNKHKKQLVEMLYHYQIPLIENDLLGDLYFSKKRPRSAKAFDQEGLVLLCSSFSKTLAPSYRVGWCVPGRYQAAVEQLKFTTSVTPNTLAQETIAAFLQCGCYDQHLRHIRKAYLEQVQRVIQCIGIHFPTGTRIISPAGGYVLWVELPKTVDSLKLQRLALAECISIAPGPTFSTLNKYHNFICINCGNPWSPVLEQGLITLGHSVTKMAFSSKCNLALNP